MGPWFTASFDSDCDDCGGMIMEGEWVRSDGAGGWLCEECGEDDDDLARWEGEGGASE